MREDELITYLQKIFAGKAKEIAIGDDCAVIRKDRKKFYLYTTDTIVADVDFSLAETPLKMIGYKALAVSLSDIAAMGGIPLYGLINIGIPSKFKLKDVKEIFKGIKKISSHFKLKIVGGDISKSRSLFISTTIIGEVEKEYLCLRKGAKGGNLVFVTGEIGASLVSGKHLHFTPRIREARYLVKNFHPTAMIDITDGFLLDLYRLCKANNLGALIYADFIPYAKLVKDKETALSEGEDYELLFSVKQELALRLPRSIPKLRTKISLVAKLIKKKGLYIKFKGKVKAVKPKGYDHFQKWN